MGNLLTSLLNSATALQAFNQALNVTENNVVNSQTPGYARQVATFQALPFDLSVGLPGGVNAGPVQSTRSAFAEQSVRQQQTALGYSSQKSTDLTGIQSLFSLSSTTGVGASINNLFSSFSALSVNPNDPTARQLVIGAAQRLAQSISGAANGVANAMASADSGAQDTIASINQLAAQLAQLNTQVLSANGRNAGVDANLNADLEQLAQYGGVTALQQPDGTVSVYLAGQIPLVMGSQAYAIQGNISQQRISILDSQGNDITSKLTSGQLGAQVDTANNTLPSYLDGLNTLAQGIAGQVNAVLAQGVDANGVTPPNSLFTYGSASTAAQTLSVSSLFTPDQIAAALPGSPGGNGNALNLAALANAKVLNGSTFTQFYGNLAGSAGQDLAMANQNQTTEQNLLTQAQSQRAQVSGVSLDQEAANLLQYQRSYQAVSKMISIIDDMTNTLVNMVP